MSAALTGGSRVYVGLGSNLDARETQIRRALRMLDDTPGVMVVRASGVYESEPMGILDQPTFLNAVAELSTTLPPEDLLNRIKEIEREMGRVPTVRWGPRLIDLDILTFDDLRIAGEKLTVPHPGMAERSFVLMPLVELCPDFRLADGKLAKDVLAELVQQAGIRRHSDIGPW